MSVSCVLQQGQHRWLFYRYDVYWNVKYNFSYVADFQWFFSVLILMYLCPQWIEQYELAGCIVYKTFRILCLCQCGFLQSLPESGINPHLSPHYCLQFCFQTNRTTSMYLTSRRLWIHAYLSAFVFWGF